MPRLNENVLRLRENTFYLVERLKYSKKASCDKEALQIILKYLPENMDLGFNADTINELYRKYRFFKVSNKHLKSQNNLMKKISLAEFLLFMLQNKQTNTEGT